MKTYLAVLLLGVITSLNLSFPTTTFAQTDIDAAKTRSKVQTLSANRDKKVEVKLRDNTKYKGHISEVESDSFTLTESKTGTSQKFAYSEVDDVKKVGGGISTKTWLIIGGVAAGSITTWLIVKPAVCDGGAQTRGLC